MQTDELCNARAYFCLHSAVDLSGSQTIAESNDTSPRSSPQLSPRPLSSQSNTAQASDASSSELQRVPRLALAAASSVASSEPNALPLISPRPPRTGDDAASAPSAQSARTDSSRSTDHRGPSAGDSTATTRAGAFAQLRAAFETGLSQYDRVMSA